MSFKTNRTALVAMAGSLAFPDIIAQLINNRLRGDRRFGQRSFTKEEVAKHLQLNDLDYDLKKLIDVILKECRVFQVPVEEVPDTLADYDFTEARSKIIRDMLDMEYISVEVLPRRNPPVVSKRDRMEEIRRMFMPVSSPSIKKSNLRESDVDIFVNFHIADIALDNPTSVPELDLVREVSHGVYDGLRLFSDIRTTPVKPPGRRETNTDIWCQLRANYYTDSITKGAAAFAAEVLGEEIIEGGRARLYFAIKDSIKETEEWGSCPLLHVGTNFKTGELSQVVYDNLLTCSVRKESVTTMNMKSADKERDTCGVYSQKGPTLEIPAKLEEINT